MWWQQEYVRENVNMPLGTAYRLELPKQGMLGSLLIRIEGAQLANYGLSGGDWRILDEISKITVLLNGSNPCKSFTGKQAAALAFYDQGVIVPGDWRNYATNTQSQYFLINFGRYYQDSSFGLDLAKYGTVEIQIENTATAADFTSLTVSILGVYLRGAQPSRFGGYLETLLHKSWVTVQNETVYTNLPMEHVLRRIMVQAQPALDANNVDKTPCFDLMDDIEFSFDTGQTRIYKGGLDDLARANYLDQGKVAIVGGTPYMSTDKGINISLGHILGFANGVGSADGAGATTFNTYTASPDKSSLTNELFEADSPANLLAAGFAPFNTALFNFDSEFDPDFWINTTERNVCKLDIHTRDIANAVGGTNSIILERLIRG